MRGGLPLPPMCADLSCCPQREGSTLTKLDQLGAVLTRRRVHPQPAWAVYTGHGPWEAFWVRCGWAVPPARDLEGPRPMAEAAHLA